MNQLNNALATSPKKLTIPGSDPILGELLGELRSFANLLKAYDLDVAIDSPAALEAWGRLDTEKKLGVLKIFGNYRRNCEEMHASGVSLRDNRAFVFHSLHRANLFAVDDARKLFNNSNLVEAYNLNDIQIFRGINFFDYCNYSLLDLLAREWMELYERLPSITNSLFAEIRAAVEAKETRAFATPSHVMRERDANPCGVFQTDLLYICPLFSAPSVLAGYLLIWDVVEIDLEFANEQKVTFLPT